mgnify:CR=1 FL=1
MAILRISGNVRIGCIYEYDFRLYKSFLIKSIVQDEANKLNALASLSLFKFLVKGKKTG